MSQLPVLLRIAIRNLREHQAKTRIAGILISLGIAVLVSGNSLIRTAAQGIRRTFIDNYTGDLVVTGLADNGVSLFGVNGNMMTEVVPTLPEYPRLLDRLRELDPLAQTTPQITGYALIQHEDRDPLFSLLFGIQPDSYRRLFDSIVIREGAYLQAGQEGILLNRGRVREIEARHGVRLRVGDPVLLSGFGAQGFRIREVTLRGTFDFTQRSEYLDQLAFMDAQSLRALLGMTVGTPEEIPVGGEETSLLQAENPDALFDEAMIRRVPDAGREDWQEQLRRPAAEEGPSVAGAESTVWHFLLVKAGDPRRAVRLIEQLNEWFQDQGLEARAIDWKRASAGFGLTADVLRLIFSGAILIVAAVAMVVIMNTLVVSVVERAAEIGTMRALGAQKGFVRRMLLVETLSITVVFGAAGILLGALILLALNLLRIPATNMFLNALFGGPVLKARLAPLAVLSAFAVVVVVGLLAHLYPVRVALKIQPVRAIQEQ